jgi:hypothetical protein
VIEKSREELRERLKVFKKADNFMCCLASTRVQLA